METAGISIALAIHSLDPTASACHNREIAEISIALAIHSLDPTKDAISDSAQYRIKFYLLIISRIFTKNRGTFPSVIRRIQKSGAVGASSQVASVL